MTGVWILGVAVVAALVFGVWRSRRDGRFAGRAQREPEQSARSESTWDRVRASGVGEAPGERATLVQFSSAFCAPCRATRRVLGEVARVAPGVVHVEVDAESHLELVRALNVMRTPTTLVLDAQGREVTRAAGAPTTQQVLAGLDAAL